MPQIKKINPDPIGHFYTLKLKLMPESTLDRLPDGYELKDTYELTCSRKSCKSEMWVKPSLSMRCGLNSGHGTCPKCGEFMHLKIDLENEGRFLTERFEDYANRIKAQKNAQK